MFFDDAQKRSIAQVVQVRARETSSGTAFLVSTTGLVLTALHTIAAGEGKGPDPSTITLAFGDPLAKSPFITKATVVAGAFSIPDDWALLQCEKIPPEAVPFELSRMVPGYKVEWTTYGFPEALDDVGMVYGGDVVSGGARLQLYSIQAASGEASRVRGLSGSPVVTGGQCVGILLEANTKEVARGVVEAREGTLHALPIEVVTAACALLTLRSEEPPFTSWVAQLLEPASEHLLPALADALAIAGADAMKPAERAREVARALLTRRLDRKVVQGLCDLVTAVEEPKDLNIVQMCAASWVDGRAANVVRGSFSASAGRSALCVNADLANTGELYALRAGERFPGWKARTRAVTGVAARQLEGLVSEVRACLCDAVGCDPEELEDDLAAHELGQDEPLIIVVPPPLPSAAVMEELRSKFDKARFLFLGGQDMTETTLAANHPKLPFVKPTIATGSERPHLDMVKKAHRELKGARRAIAGG